MHYCAITSDCTGATGTHLYQQERKRIEREYPETGHLAVLLEIIYSFETRSGLDASNNLITLNIHIMTISNSHVHSRKYLPPITPRRHIHSSISARGGILILYLFFLRFTLDLPTGTILLHDPNCRNYTRQRKYTQKPPRDKHIALLHAPGEHSANQSRTSGTT